MKKARGSALVIAMLMIASIGAIAFGIARIVFFESNITTLHENSVVAYYAAESGIEEGFLRYRYNTNAEVPFKDWYQSSEANRKYFRTNLENLVVDNGSDWGGVVSDPADYFHKAQQSYDLRMGYLGTSGSPTYYADSLSQNAWSPDQINSPTFGAGENSFLKIAKDENYKFDLSNYKFDITTNWVALGLKFINVDDPSTATPGLITNAEACKAIAEVKFIAEDYFGNKAEYKALTSSLAVGGGSSVCEALSGLGGSLRYAGVPVTSSKNDADKSFYYRYNNLIGDMLTRAGAAYPPGGRYKKAELQVKPLYYPVMAMFGEKNCAVIGACGSADTVVTGPYTSIKSVGYYGGTTKTLTANIDRQSGTLYDLFDYVIYNNGS